METPKEYPVEGFTVEPELLGHVCVPRVAGFARLPFLTRVHLYVHHKHKHKHKHRRDRTICVRAHFRRMLRISDLARIYEDARGVQVTYFASHDADYAFSALDRCLFYRIHPHVTVPTDDYQAWVTEMLLREGA